MSDGVDLNVDTLLFSVDASSLTFWALNEQDPCHSLDGKTLTALLYSTLALPNIRPCFCLSVQTVQKPLFIGFNFDSFHSSSPALSPILSVPLSLRLSVTLPAAGCYLTACSCMPHPVCAGSGGQTWSLCDTQDISQAIAYSAWALVSL